MSQERFTAVLRRQLPDGDKRRRADFVIRTDLAGATSWKRSIQRSGAHATNGAASANGFTASFVKVRTNDGKYYIFKGMVSAGASAGPGGTSTNASGIAKSKAGRY
jgi:hypothetical protein